MDLVTSSLPRPLTDIIIAYLVWNQETHAGYWFKHQLEALTRLSEQECKERVFAEFGQYVARRQHASWRETYAHFLCVLHENSKVIHHVAGHAKERYVFRPDCISRHYRREVVLDKDYTHNDLLIVTYPADVDPGTGVEYATDEESSDDDDDHDDDADPEPGPHSRPNTRCFIVTAWYYNLSNHQDMIGSCWDLTRLVSSFKPRYLDLVAEHLSFPDYYIQWNCDPTFLSEHWLGDADAVFIVFARYGVRYALVLEPAQAAPAFLEYVLRIAQETPSIGIPVRVKCYASFRNDEVARHISEYFDVNPRLIHDLDGSYMPWIDMPV